MTRLICAQASTTTRCPEGSSRSVLLVSPHDIQGRPWGGVTFEFLNVVSEMERGTVVAPAGFAYAAPPLRRVSKELVPLVNRLSHAVRSSLGLPAARQGSRAEITGTYDLCFYACHFPREIGEIDNVPDWRRRSRIACAFVLETWPELVEQNRANYRLLDRFDLVFVVNAQSIPLIRAHTSAPVAFLSTGADALLVPAPLFDRERVIDLLCIGRRKRSVHAALLAHAIEHEKLYLYDIWDDMHVRDWHAARRYNAELTARAKFCIVWSPTGPGRGRAGSNEAISARYFEAAAGGSVILGSRPRLPEFDRLFDWPDAVIDLPTDAEAVGPFVQRLEADPARLARVRWRNRREALLRHDWAHRWSAVLDTLGLERTAAHTARLETLAARAEAEARSFRPPVVPWRRLVGPVLVEGEVAKPRCPQDADAGHDRAGARGAGNGPAGTVPRAVPLTRPRSR